MESSVVRRIPQKAIFALLFTFIVVIIVLLLPKNQPPQDSVIWNYDYSKVPYNSTYPLTQPISMYCICCQWFVYVKFFLGTGSYIKFKIGVVADQDQDSKV